MFNVLMNEIDPPQPVTNAYLLALGRAVYEFSLLEWNAIWCCEKASAGSLVWARKVTSGKIAERLVVLANESAASSYKAQWLAEAKRFKLLVGRRNDLLHASPGIAHDGVTLLSRNWVDWTVQALNEATSEFRSNSMGLNRLLHGPLSTLS